MLAPHGSDRPIEEPCRGLLGKFTVRMIANALRAHNAPRSKPTVTGAEAQSRHGDKRGGGRHRHRARLLPVQPRFPSYLGSRRCASVAAAAAPRRGGVGKAVVGVRAW
jgi:hypothetical protein